ncbi:MAG: DUF222 domain-containing protein [Acidimicrobiales bacterium]|jgi:hypothetical protein
MDLDVLREAIDQLGGSEPSACADTQSIEELQRLLARLEAFVTESTAAFDAARNWEPDGARSAAAWLSFRCGLPRGEARRLVRRGRGLRHLPGTAEAWARGDVNGAKVDVLTSLRTDATEAALVRDEKLLVDQAGSLRHDQFVRAAAYWKQLADPDGTDEDGERRRTRRDVFLVNGFGDMWFGKMTLDPISGTIVSDELERIERLLFEADWVEARRRLGREPKVTDLARTPSQRRADALVEMAARSKTCPAGGRRPAPLYTVLVGWETLHGRICQLEDGTVVPPGSLLAGLHEADLERAVFTPRGRVEISHSSRLFGGATRRAIEVRDQECTHPYCDVPAPSCEVDHIQPWAAGGPTTQENGRLLCGRHNRMRHQRPPPAAA